MTTIERKTAKMLYNENPWPRRMVKARKQYRCDVCADVIPKASLYVVKTLYPDTEYDSIATYHAHDDCDTLLEKFGNEFFGGEFEYWPYQVWPEWVEFLTDEGIEVPNHD